MLLGGSNLSIHSLNQKRQAQLTQDWYKLLAQISYLSIEIINLEEKVFKIFFKNLLVFRIVKPMSLLSTRSEIISRMERYWRKFHVLQVYLTLISPFRFSLYFSSKISLIIIYKRKKKFVSSFFLVRMDRVENVSFLNSTCTLIFVVYKWSIKKSKVL